MFCTEKRTVLPAHLNVLSGEPVSFLVISEYNSNSRTTLVSLDSSRFLKLSLFSYKREFEIKTSFKPGKPHFFRKHCLKVRSCFCQTIRTLPHLSRLAPNLST